MPAHTPRLKPHSLALALAACCRPSPLQPARTPPIVTAT